MTFIPSFFLSTYYEQNIQNGLTCLIRACADWSKVPNKPKQNRSKTKQKKKKKIKRMFLQL